MGGQFSQNSNWVPQFVLFVPLLILVATYLTIELLTFGGLRLDTRVAKYRAIWLGE